MLSSVPLQDIQTELLYCVSFKLPFLYCVKKRLIEVSLTWNCVQSLCGYFGVIEAHSQEKVKTLAE